MQPRRIAFTDKERDELGEYLDIFARQGSIESLSEEAYMGVQSLIAYKIWSIRPDIAREIQNTGDMDVTPVLLIENVPIDDELPDTPKFMSEVLAKHPPLRSHFFSAGVGLIRNGNVISPSDTDLLNVLQEYESPLSKAKNVSRDWHRDIFNTKYGDIGLHAQRGNPNAATPLFSIDEIPDHLAEVLKQPIFKIGKGKEPILLDLGNAGLRFKQEFISQRTYSDEAQGTKAISDLFDLMAENSKKNPIVLKPRDYLLIDQSRVFHSAKATDLEPNAEVPEFEKRRWLTHMRWEVNDGSTNLAPDRPEIPFYLKPEYVDSSLIMSDLTAPDKEAASQLLRQYIIELQQRFAELFRKLHWLG